MSTELKVIGYLNRFERDVMPIAATPVFQSGSRRYVRERSGARDIGENEMLELEDRGWITWLGAGVVSSDEGRFLLHEDVADLLQGNHPAALAQPYLLPAEECTRRTELANVYLDRAIATLHKISGNDVYGNDSRFEDAMIELEHTARARPEMLAVRVLQAAIADYFDNPSWVSTVMEGFRFELSRSGISRWGINLNEHKDFGRGWHDFRISENGLVINVTRDDRYPRMGYESNAAVDKFSLRWFRDVAKLVHDWPWLAAYGNLLKIVSLFQLLVLHVRGQPIEEESTELLKHYVASMPLKSSEIKVSLDGDHLGFSLWSVSIDSETKSAARANALAGRVMGMLAVTTGHEKSIECIAYELGRRLSNNAPVYDRLIVSKALMEMEGHRQGGRKLERELINRFYTMKVYEDLKLPEEAHEEARLMAARADYQRLSQAYTDSQFNTYDYRHISDAIEYVGYTYTQLGLVHFGVSAYEAAEDSFDKAHQYLQLPMDDVRSHTGKPTRRLLDWLAFSTYMLALLKSDRVQAGKAVDYYDELDALYGNLTPWQNRCWRIADALKNGNKATGDQDACKFIRDALGVVGSRDLATLKTKVKKLYGWSIGRGNDGDNSIVNPENYELLLNDLVNLYQDRPNDDEITIMLLKARVAIFKAVLNKLLPDYYDTPGYTLSELSAKNQAAELRDLLKTTKLAEKTKDAVLTQQHAHELLAKYFLRRSNFEMAQLHNDSLIGLNKEDLIATMRKFIINGAIATTQQQVLVAAKSLEESAAGYEKLGNAGEAARRYFGAGAICSSAIYRFKIDYSDSLLHRAINLYRKAVTSKHPPHTAAVYRLAENLYIFGESSEAMTRLERIDATDWRAAVLYARIVCSSPELIQNIPVAENRLAVALRSFLQEEPHSRTTFCRLVDVGCSLRALLPSPPQMTEPEWLDVMRVAANDQGIFGAGLNVLLHHRVLTVGLAEFCNKTLQKPRSDTREILRYYLGYLANMSSGNSAQVRQLSLGTDVLKPEDIIAIVPDMERIMDDGKSEVRDLLKDNQLWGSEFDHWLSSIEDNLDLNRCVLDAAKSAVPKLVSTHKLMEFFELSNEPKDEQLVWGDVTVLRNLCRVLNKTKNTIQKPSFHLGVDGISFHLPESQALMGVESDAVIQHSVIRSGGKYLAADREIRLAFQSGS